MNKLIQFDQVYFKELDSLFEKTLKLYFSKYLRLKLKINLLMTSGFKIFTRSQ